MDEKARTIRQEKRKRQILGATLRLLRRHGTSISTAQIAAEASCSKETLYAWFEDREGILRALVEEQAKSMGDALARSFSASKGEFRDRLSAYCLALLDIMTGEAVIAVNRVAMADACREGADLGLAVVDDWQARVVGPFVVLLNEGHDEEVLDFDDAEEAFEVLMGLLIGDRQRRLLLGEESRPELDEMQAIVERAVTRFMRLFAA